MNNVFEKFRLPEEEINSAFDKTPATFRAAIKTAIGMTSFHFNPRPGLTTTMFSSTHVGFQEVRTHMPSPSAAIVFPAEYKAAAPICAAASLATLSEVLNVLAITIDGKPTDEIITTLALCGVENIFSISRQDMLELAGHLPGGTPTIIFNQDLDELASQCFRKGLQIYQAHCRNKILVLAPQVFDLALIGLLHGIKPKEIQTQFSSHIYYDAMFIAKGEERQKEEMLTRLVLTPGCEGFWMLPSLTQDFFFTETLRMAMLEMEEG